MSVNVVLLNIGFSVFGSLAAYRRAGASPVARCRAAGSVESASEFAQQRGILPNTG